MDRRSTTLFVVGEPFTCLDHQNPWAAKIAAITDDHYIVHYYGFNKNQDEKIKIGKERGRMFKMTLEEYSRKYNVEVSKDALDKEKLRHPKIKNVESQGPSSSSTPRSARPAQRSPEMREALRKRLERYQNRRSQKLYFLGEPIKLTENLTKVLVKDYVMVTQQGMLPVVPTEYSVERIMEEYANLLEEEKKENREEVNSGIGMYYLTLKDHFDIGFNKTVLITPERDQHIARVKKVLSTKKIRFRRLENVDRKDYSPSKDYGIAHLLRLIQRFEKLLMPHFNQDLVKAVRMDIEDFVLFLDDNLEEFYDSDGYKKKV